ncbi:hypothetical protein F4703DRAFT_1968167 [Phycomyces blakesleeanus]
MAISAVSAISAFNLGLRKSRNMKTNKGLYADATFNHLMILCQLWMSSMRAIQLSNFYLRSPEINSIERFKGIMKEKNQAKCSKCSSHQSAYSVPHIGIAAIKHILVLFTFVLFYMQPLRFMFLIWIASRKFIKKNYVGSPKTLINLTFNPIFIVALFRFVFYYLVVLKEQIYKGGPIGYLNKHR